MQWQDIQWQPSPRTLRQFAALWLVFFLLLAWWFGWASDRPLVGWILAGLALGVGGLGLAVPAAVKPVFVGWTVLAFPIGWLISRLVLGIMFYLVFTPLGLFFRLVGRDPRHLRRPASPVESYWLPKTQAADPKQYLKQF
ncbi:MAG TPA: SxtJ family membrane protein [Gemmatales bacterium]|nr:SxtJ family membrane protein [Gemmatales bacterium]